MPLMLRFFVFHRAARYFRVHRQIRLDLSGRIDRVYIPFFVLIQHAKQAGMPNCTCCGGMAGRLAKKFGYLQELDI